MLEQAWDALGMEISNLNTERGWESIYGKNIAWNYFENEGDPQKCIDLEVSTGKRWFKFRHLNELRLTVELENAFGPRVPTLILGHTHEPRFRPRKASGQSGHSQNWQEIDFYANSGSAGRFENLIWGIEILDRAPLLISWHRDGDRMPVRTVWESFGTNGGFLRPASSWDARRISGSRGGFRGGFLQRNDCRRSDSLTPAANWITIGTRHGFVQRSTVCDLAGIPAFLDSQPSPVPVGRLGGQPGTGGTRSRLNSVTRQLPDPVRIGPVSRPSEPPRKLTGFASGIFTAKCRSAPVRRRTRPSFVKSGSVRRPAFPTTVMSSKPASVGLT